MSDSPALNKLMNIDSIDHHPEEIKTERLNEAKVIVNDLWCGRHHKHKVKGQCPICEMEARTAIEQERRQRETEAGNEKWIKRTCFKKDRQTKKYVMKMMGLTGRQYRKLMKKVKRKENEEQIANTI